MKSLSDRSARRIFGGTIWRKNTRVDAPPTPGQRTKNVNTITRGDQNCTHTRPPSPHPQFVTLIHSTVLLLLRNMRVHFACDETVAGSYRKDNKMRDDPLFCVYQLVARLHGCTIIDKHYNCICTLRYV